MEKDGSERVGRGDTMMRTTTMTTFSLKVITMGSRLTRWKFYV